MSMCSYYIANNCICILLVKNCYEEAREKKISHGKITCGYILKAIKILKVMKCYTWMSVLPSRKKEKIMSIERKKKKKKESGKSWGFLWDCLMYNFFIEKSHEIHQNLY